MTCAGWLQVKMEGEEEEEAEEEGDEAEQEQKEVEQGEEPVRWRLWWLRRGRAGAGA